MSLAHPSQTAQVLKKHGIRLSKNLGQNFLVDENILDKIEATAEVSSKDVVLEVGPGIGTLTERLAASAKKVIAIELDYRFVDIIRTDTLKGIKNLEIIQGDALEVDLATLKPTPTLVVANLPYKVAVPIIMRFLTDLTTVGRFVFMVQREIADRLTSGPGTKEYGAVTVKAGYLADIRTVLKVSRNSFMPVPGVDSTVIEVVRSKSRKIPEIQEILFSCIEAAFSQRRKTVRNSIGSFLRTHFCEAEMVRIFTESGIDMKKRGEDLDLGQFVALAVVTNAVMTRKT